MTCAELQSELIDFHFGDLDDDRRARIEQHLMECRGCLRALLELKRNIETTAEHTPPSIESYRHLRRAVANELASSAPPRWFWWERPAAFACAGAAVLAALFAVNLLARQPATSPHGLDNAPGTMEEAPRQPAQRPL